MNTPYSQVGSSPREGDDYTYSTTPQPPHAAAVSRPSGGQHFIAANHSSTSTGAPHTYAHFDEQLYVSANNASQYLDFDLQRSSSQPQQIFIARSPSAVRTDHELLRGLASYVADSSPRCPHRETSSLLSQQALPSSLILPSTHSALGTPDSRIMSSSPQVTSAHHSLYHAAPTRQSKYEPFQARFHDAKEARDHRRRGTRFDRQPYCSPNTDHTIAEIENNRPVNVMRIYNAMTSGEAARDNPGSIAMKRWVNDAHYPADLVEAYAHKVFDCLLDQAKEGFRGWVHNDYVADERKGDDIDKDVDCAGRFENIILALEQEKTICEDVMNSACQIRMFVNAPRAYSNRKHQNRIGNSKRGRAKDTPDPNPKAAKARRTAAGRTRAQSSSMSTLPPSRESTPQQHQQQQHSLQRASLVPPYYSSPASQQLSPSPNLPISYPAPHSVSYHRPIASIPASRGSFIHHSSAAMSPPTPSSHMPQALQAYLPRMTTEAPHGLPPATVPSQLHGTHSMSAPTSPDDIKPISGTIASNVGAHAALHMEMPEFSSWMQDTSGVDPLLAHWDLSPHTPSDAGASAAIVSEADAVCVNMSQLESSVAGSMDQSKFEEFWRMHVGVQEFPLSSSDGQVAEKQNGS